MLRPVQGIMPTADRVARHRVSPFLLTVRRVRETGISNLGKQLRGARNPVSQGKGTAPVLGSQTVQNPNMWSSENPPRSSISPW